MQQPSDDAVRRHNELEEAARLATLRRDANPDPGENIAEGAELSRVASEVRDAFQRGR